MYPRLSDLFQDLFGISFPIPIYSFGAMVAVAILTGAWLGRKELDRMYGAGLISGVAAPDDEAPRGKKGKRRRMVLTSPSVLIGTITVIAVVAGFTGAKVFHILENLPEFFANPARMVFSSGGFTFYGGLIVAALSIAYYVRKHGVSVPRFADALAPGLMIGYGIGRLGCHLSGDGDWGIASDPAARPGWLPAWLWNETYPNRIYDPIDPPFPASGVYPTPIYEFLGCLLLFAVLWGVRKHPFKAGWLFSLYLLLNGIERFLIEQIRVNNAFEVFGFQVTQAEVLAVLLMLAGGIGLLRTSRRIAPVAATPDGGVVLSP